MKRKDGSYQVIPWTILLLMILGVCFAAAVRTIHAKAQENCDLRMEETAAQLTNMINQDLHQDRTQLEIVAGVLADLEDPEEIRSYLRQNCTSSHFSALYFRPKSGALIAGGFASPMLKEYTEAASQMTELTPISQIIHTGEGRREKFFCHAVPVENGKTRGVLCGFVSLEQLQNSVSTTVYGGECQIYLVDGNTGDYLVDTWHNELGNLFDGSMGSREYRKGFSFEKEKEEIQSGQSGTTVFRSRTTGEWSHTYYMPLGVNNWSLLLTIPEPVAFAQQSEISSIICRLAAVVIIVTALLLLVMTRSQRRFMADTDRLLKARIYMYDIQQTLFDAYEDPDLVSVALEKVAKKLSASGVVALSFRDGEVFQLFEWSSDGTNFRNEIMGRDLKADFPDGFCLFEQGQSVRSFGHEDPGPLSEEKIQLLEKRGIHNLMFVPVLNSDGTLQGAIGAVNMAKKWDDCEDLERVAMGFVVALRNRSTYQSIYEMGVSDAVTGLKNRHSFDKILPELAKSDFRSLHCVFADANALHLINNSFGHQAGDVMLQTIADCIRAELGNEHAFRVGGDEFVVFRPNSTDEEIFSMVHAFKQRVEDYGYHVSVGFASKAAGSSDMEALVSEAEERMYRDKAEFYRTNGDAKLLARNQSMETVLRSKQDADNFIELVSERYIACYVVDMKTNDTRVVCKPAHFDEFLSRCSYAFQEAIGMYSEAYTAPEFLKGLNEFCDNDKLMEIIKKGQIPEYLYRTKAGERVRIRVYPTLTYTSEKPETIWIFERLDM